MEGPAIGAKPPYIFSSSFSVLIVVASVAFGSEFEFGVNSMEFDDSSLVSFNGYLPSSKADNFKKPVLKFNKWY